MQRRAALRRLARLGALGATVGVAGCGSSDPASPGTGGAGGVPTGGDTGTTPGQGAPEGPANPDGSPFAVADFGYQETSDGELRVTVTVENEGDDQATGRVVVVVTVGEGSDATTSEDGTELTIAAGDRETFDAEFGVAYDEFVARGSIRFRFE